MPSSPDLSAVVAQVRDSYSTPEALASYRKRVDHGLRIWETTVIREHFPPRGRVLTLGCGAGRETFALEQLGYDTSGADLSQPLLDIAAELANARGHRSSFSQVDGETLRFNDATFDVVTLWAQMLGDVPSRAHRLTLLREVRRVLGPTGLATCSAHDDARTRPELDPADIISADSPEPGDLLIYERREAATRYRHLFTRDELHDLTRQAGFSAVHIVHTSDLGETWGNVLVATCRP